GSEPRRALPKGGPVPTIRPHPRLLPVLALSVAFMASLVTRASATGPGGWDRLGNGGTPGTPSLNGAVDTMTTAPGVLIVGGAFHDAGGLAAADYIAKWDGSTWSALGSSPLNGTVDAIAYYGGKIYAGGQFTNAGGNTNADFLAVWDGSTWAPF